MLEREEFKSNKQSETTNPKTPTSDKLLAKSVEELELDYLANLTLKTQEKSAQFSTFE